VDLKLADQLNPTLGLSTGMLASKQLLSTNLVTWFFLLTI